MQQKGIDYIAVGIVYFCHDGGGNFIMAKRSKNARDEHGKWDIGGGSLEFGEKVEDGLKREIKEEYGTDIINYEFLGFRDVHRVNGENKKTHWIALDFKVLIDKDMIKNGEPEKFDEIKWFTLAMLPEGMHSQLGIFFEKYREKIKS